MATTPLDYNIATMEEIAAYLRNDAYVDNQDVIIIANAITDAVEGGCRGPVKAREFVEKFDTSRAVGGDYIPNVQPVASLTKLEHVNHDGSIGSEVDSSDYQLIANTRLSLYGRTFQPGKLNYQLTYEAGYETIPSDLYQFYLEEIARSWRAKDREQEGVLDHTGDGVVLRYDRRRTVKRVREELAHRVQRW